MLEVAGEINSGLSGNKTSNEPHRHSHTRLIAALFKGRTKGLGGYGAGWSRWYLKREKKRQKITVFPSWLLQERLLCWGLGWECRGGMRGGSGKGRHQEKCREGIDTTWDEDLKVRAFYSVQSQGHFWPHSALAEEWRVWCKLIQVAGEISGHGSSVPTWIQLPNTGNPQMESWHFLPKILISRDKIQMPELLSENTLPVPSQNSAFNEEQLPVHFPSLGKYKADCPEPWSTLDPSFQSCWWCTWGWACRREAHTAHAPSLACSFLPKLGHPGTIPPPKSGLKDLAVIFSV